MVGYDGSDSATRAPRCGCRPRRYGSTLEVVAVRTTESDHLLTEDAREQLQRRLVEAAYHETSGEPAKQLVKKAHELRADLLVIGRRNGGPLLGSVSSKVVRRANCDVLVVR